MGMFDDMADFMLKSDVSSSNLYDYSYIRDRFSDFKYQYEQKNQGRDYSEDIYWITDKYLKSDKLAYLKFGVYWWAVKRILEQKGFSGYHGDVPEAIAERYVYKLKNGTVDDMATLIAGWEHKDEYNRTYLQGNREFTLPNGELYQLVDLEWELLNF